MGTVLSFKRALVPLPHRDSGTVTTTGEIVIFPGVRIERDPSESVMPADSDSDDGGFGGVGGKGRPRKSS